MRDLTDRALDTAAQLGATYADVRVVRRRDESIQVKGGLVEGVALGDSEGFGVRVLVDGAWGFAASDTLELAEADRVGALAVRIAKASATALRNRVQLDDRPPANGTFETPMVEDPFKIPLEEKINDLVEADRIAGGVKGVTFTESMYAGHREWKTFAATDGSFTEQVITQVGAAVEANAIEGDEHQRRSYPDSGGGYQAGGYEYVRSLDLKGHAGTVGEEAVALLTAPQLPPGRRTLVLDPSMLYLQLHESCGHPTELDRVFGTEASYAGTSFLTTDKLDEGFMYGSELVTIVADATAAGGLGTFGWDDEGVAAQAVPLVQNGKFVGYQSSRETAPRIGRQSGGGMRADGWNRIPLIRMTNVNMLPVPGMSLDEIVADTDDGLYLANNRSWSIDDRRLNFQFATEVAYEIKGGVKGRLFKNCTYTGITYEFWRSCDAVGNSRSFVMLGTPNCGKGEPSQTARVGHAVPGARFRNVQVGVGKWYGKGGGAGPARRIHAEDPESALGLAEDVLGRALRIGATEAEVLVVGGDSSLTQFANSEIHQNVAERSVSVNLRYVVGKRIAVVSTGKIDTEGLRALVHRAAAIARSCEELPDWAGLPGPSGTAGSAAAALDPEARAAAASGRSAAAGRPSSIGWADGTAGATPEFRAEGVRAVIAAADAVGAMAYGSFSTDAEAIAVANSAGIRSAERRTSSQLLTVHMSPDGGTGYAEAVSMDAATIDAAAIGREAAAKARASDNAVSIPAGDYPVVLEEYAVVDITDQLGYLGFNALSVQEERSFAEPGRRIGSDLVTIVDDGSDRNGLPMAFDYEGVAKQRVPLVEAGVCREVVYDSQTAARAGHRSTGHGLPAPNPYGPFPLNAVMSPGTASREELIGGLERGLLVTRFHYTNVVHPKLAIITGMTRDGTFLVEGGRLVGPVRNLRYTQSYLDALAGVSAVSRERKAVRGFLGAAVVPALRIDGWTFTGITEH